MIPRALDVVLAHDYLNQRGGAERVVVELMDAFPSAPLYTSMFRAKSTWPQFRGRDIRTSPLQRLPVDARFRALFPLFPLAFRALGELDGDVVISSSSGWAHGVRTSPRALHLVYCYTPARWLYGEDYLARPLVRRVLAPALAAARRWDQRAARRADGYIAISAFVADRIRHVYGIGAPVVYPPVEVGRFRPTPRGDRVLVVARLLRYKRVDVIVDAARAAGFGLDVVGTGPALARLREIAGPATTFHGALDDASVAELMQGCRALCIPGIEDFGITAVEAQAAGKPVVAFGAGGALETVQQGVSGTFFHTQDTASVRAALDACDAIQSSPQSNADSAQRFAPERFRSDLRAAIARFQDARPATNRGRG